MLQFLGRESLGGVPVWVWLAITAFAVVLGLAVGIPIYQDYQIYHHFRFNW